MREPIFLILGGESYELRPDFANLVALEESFGQPLIEIADIFIGGSVPLKLIAAALAVMIGWPADDQAALGDEIVAAGVGRVLETLQKFFLASLGIGDLENAHPGESRDPEELSTGTAGRNHSHISRGE